jgi:hypothetical protein
MIGTEYVPKHNAIYKQCQLAMADIVNTTYTHRFYPVRSRRILKIVSDKY